MAALRTVIGTVLLACAGVVSLLGFAYDGYTEDAGSTPLSTMWWAIPWAAATAVLAVLVLGALLDATRRPVWSWLGLAVALLMALALAALLVSA